MRILIPAFWILLGLWFLGVHFAYQEPILGILALIIGVLSIAG